jgi:protein phosphatase
MIEFEFGQAAYAGARDYQEDTCRFERLKEANQQRNGTAGQTASALLAVLADGMGGHAGGAVASRTVCETFARTFMSGPQGIENTVDRNAQSLHEALQAGNSAIQSQVAGNPALRGMGSTLVAVRFDRRGMMWISVGDSPLYIFRDGRIEQINDDHSLAPQLDRLVGQREMTREEAENHPQRNALRSAVMGNKLEIIDRRSEFLPLKPGQWIVLASDGLESLSPQQIGDVLKANYTNGAQAVADALIDAVRRRAVPFQDNTTVMVVRPYDLDGRAGSRPTLSLRPPPGFGSISDIIPAPSVQLMGKGAAALLALAVLVWIGALAGGFLGSTPPQQAAVPPPNEPAAEQLHDGPPPGGTTPQQPRLDEKKDAAEQKTELPKDPRTAAKPEVPPPRADDNRRGTPEQPQQSAPPPSDASRASEVPTARQE